MDKSYTHGRVGLDLGLCLMAEHIYFGIFFAAISAKVGSDLYHYRKRELFLMTLLGLSNIKILYL